jgi:HSP20 family protein
MVRSRFHLTDILNDPFVARGLSALEALQQELGQVASRGFKPPAGQSVPVNVGYRDDKVRVVAEIPGTSLDALSVTVHGRVVDLAGKREPRKLKAGAKVLRQERWCGEFRRVVELPFEVDADAVDAVYVKGVLTVTLSRKKVSEARKIRVKAE